MPRLGDEISVKRRSMDGATPIGKSPWQAALRARTGGFMTDQEKSVLAKAGPVDILIGAIAANVVAEANEAVLMPMVETYRPAVYFPAHHEEEVGRNVDRATEPMFQYIKNRFPGTVTISREFREPTCFDTRLNLQSGNAKR
jgi:hypothetical protein